MNSAPTTPLLSVIIPCYNERLTIRAICEAVYRQPIRSLEVIIVDDASTDGTREELNAVPLLGRSIAVSPVKG